MKKIHSKLSKFIKFGVVEIKPFDNILEDDLFAKLEKNKVFKHYVDNSNFIVTDEDTSKDKYEHLKELTIEEFQDEHTIDELKAICKDLGLRNYKDLSELELIEKIQAKI